jgi:hypothetical protein
MTTTTSTRRSFIWIAGSALSAPLAAVAGTVTTNAPPDENSIESRLALLEDVNAIRAANQEYARRINAGGLEEIVSVVADDFGDQDVIEIAADRETAIAVVHCIAEVEEVIGPSCPLVGMAREQGGGVVRRTERIVFEHQYGRSQGVWKILRSSYRRMPA